MLLARPAEAQIEKLPHPDTTPGNFFGVAVAMDSSRALVGASGEAVCGANAGAAYVFERDAAGLWDEVARLVPSVCIPGEFFGRSVALSGDRALVAASAEFFATQASNAAYLFERLPDGTWDQIARLTVESPVEEGAFAASVDLDGNRALVTTWGDASRGRYHGAAYVFEPDSTGTWRQTARLTPSGLPETGIFGGAAVLNGNRAVVAASTYFRRTPGSVYVFEQDATTGAWAEVAHFGGIDDFFIALALEEDRLLVGASKAGRRDQGAAYVYDRSPDGTWMQTARLEPRTPYDDGGFGRAVSLDGGRALVAGYDEQLGHDFNIDRVVYVFEEVLEGDAPTGTWLQRQIVDIGEVAFGTDLDLDGAWALIGRASEDEAGAAYVVRIHTPGGASQ